MLLSKRQHAAAAWPSGGFVLIITCGFQLALISQNFSSLFRASSKPSLSVQLHFLLLLRPLCKGAAFLTHLSERARERTVMEAAVARGGARSAAQRPRILPRAAALASFVFLACFASNWLSQRLAARSSADDDTPGQPAQPPSQLQRWRWPDNAPPLACSLPAWAAAFGSDGSSPPSAPVPAYSHLQDVSDDPLAAYPTFHSHEGEDRCVHSNVFWRRAGGFFLELGALEGVSARHACEDTTAEQ